MTLAAQNTDVSAGFVAALDARYTRTDTATTVFWRQVCGEDNPPRVWNRKLAGNGFEQITLLRAPESAIGHKGMAHGGFLATLLDEAMCKCAFPTLPHHTGVTANLNLTYRAPTPSGSWIALRGTAANPDGGRKATVEGGVYLIGDDASRLPWDDASPSVETRVVVIEPKWYERLALDEK